MVVGEVLMERTHSLREVYKEEYTWKSGGKQGGGEGEEEKESVGTCLMNWTSTWFAIAVIINVGEG